MKQRQTGTVFPNEQPDRIYGTERLVSEKIQMLGAKEFVVDQTAATGVS